MTIPVVSPAGDRTSVLGRLMAAVRPEFRGDELLFDAEDPVFGGGTCRVPDCIRSARGRGLCPGHLQRWVDDGRPDLDVFVASTDPRWARQQPNQQCQVAGCGYGVARSGLCVLHAQRWIRSGRSDLQGWLANRPAIKQPAPGASCHVEHCQLWPQAALPFCHAHAATWRANGRPELDQFVQRFAKVTVLADESIWLGGLGPQLKLEIQYALQCRHNERITKTPPMVVMQVVRFLTGVGETSLLHRCEQDWRSAIGRPAPKDCNPRALLRLGGRVFPRRLAAAASGLRRTTHGALRWHPPAVAG